MWRTTISVQYFTAQVPEKISELKAKVKLTKQSCFNKWSPLTLPALQRACYQSFQSSGYLSWKILEDLMGDWTSFVFSRVMRHDRFKLLFWVPHVNQSTTPLKRIDKVQLFVEKILSMFQSKYTPSRELAVDETMLKFRGRFMGKPYMSKKPTKWGTKCFSLADSCNGYIINVLLLCRRGAFSRTGCFFLLYAKSVPPSWIAITSPLLSQSCPLNSSGRSAWFFTIVSVKTVLQGPLLLQLVSLALCHRRGCTTT